MFTALRLPILFALCISFVFPPSVFAAPPRLLSNSQEPGLVSEYSSQAEGEFLIPVTLLGAVGRPGYYKIPLGSDLIKLLSLASGPTQDAELGKILIRSKNKRESTRVNLETNLEESLTQTPILSANDVVYIPRHRPLIDQETLVVIGFVSTLLGLVLTSLALADRFSK